MLANPKPLGDLAQVRTGRLDANAAVEGGRFPFFTCATDPLRIDETAFDSKAVLVAGNGDLNVKYYEGPFNAYQRTYVVESRDHAIACPKYLYYFLSRYVEKLRELSIGGVIKYIRLHNLTEAKVPLPPIEEQRRVAAILDAADGLRTKRRQALAKLDTLTQAVFIDMFGGLSELETQPLEKAFSEKPIFGTMIPGAQEGQWLDLRVANIQGDRLDLTDKKFVDLDQKNLDRHSVKDGDLLLARAIASQKHLGKCIVVEPGKRDWAFDSHLMRVRLNSAILSPTYLKAWLSTVGGRAAFLRVTRRSSVQFNINTKEISRLRVPIPDRESQMSFEKAAHAVERRRDSLTSQANHLDTLFASLQQRAFAGEL